MKNKISKQRVAFLLKVYTQGMINDEEMRELSDFVKDPEFDPVLLELLTAHWEDLPADDAVDIPKDQIFKNILSNERFLSSKEKGKIIHFNKYKNLRLYAAAAILAVVCGVAVLLINKTSDDTKAPLSANRNPSLKLKPDSKRATLTLSDGRTVALDHTLSKSIVDKENLSLDQTLGLLKYQTVKQLHTVAVAAENAVTTPRGGEYRLILSDGTKVWLNAASKLSFPVAFSGKDRRVRVSGEAYFEVAKHKDIPFIVEANGTEIAVLGTHFDVNAYADNSYVKTTLVEGSVKVSKGGVSRIIKPNQQALSSHASSSILVSDVDIEQATAWKNGYFMFDQENIREVMKLISRWYDVDVVFEGNVENKNFGGTISRSSDIRSLLNSIELTNAVHFEIRGRRVIVMP